MFNLPGCFLTVSDAGGSREQSQALKAQGEAVAQLPLDVPPSLPKDSKPGKALHFSTADHPWIGYQPWLNIGSVRLRFGVARTHLALYGVKNALLAPGYRSPDAQNVMVKAD